MCTQDNAVHIWTHRPHQMYELSSWRCACGFYREGIINQALAVQPPKDKQHCIACLNCHHLYRWRWGQYFPAVFDILFVLLPFDRHFARCSVCPTNKHGLSEILISKVDTCLWESPQSRRHSKAVLSLQALNLNSDRIDFHSFWNV